MSRVTPNPRSRFRGRTVGHWSADLDQSTKRSRIAKDLNCADNHRTNPTCRLIDPECQRPPGCIEIAMRLLANGPVQGSASPRWYGRLFSATPPRDHACPHRPGFRRAAHMLSRQVSAQRRGAGAGRHADLHAPALLHATLARVLGVEHNTLSCSCHTEGLRNGIDQLGCRVSAPS
jgi:hypothetical protein